MPRDENYKEHIGQYSYQAADLDGPATSYLRANVGLDPELETAIAKFQENTPMSNAQMLRTALRNFFEINA